uniref:Uncharacterized protein n=1 Tax=Lactuca sativa TaxID=4236 RepID=A0A9R1UQ24_LACSA|nr:hypothetical protein LSAT_V11C800407150 [Lactuca sativa]
MPVIIITFIIGAARGWQLFILTKLPPQLKGLILGVCSAFRAVCKQKGSHFGDPIVCHDSSNNIVKETITMKDELTESLLRSSTSNVNKMGKPKWMLGTVRQHFGNFSRPINLKVVLSPTTTKAKISSFIINLVGLIV